MFTPADQIPVSVRRKAAAFHEAGHILVGIVLGRRVTGAILRPPNGTNGETQFEQEPEKLLDPNVAADRHMIEDAIVVLMAGQVAEAIFWRRVSLLYKPLVDTHRDDDEEIARLKAAFHFTPQKDAEYVAHCMAKTQGIVLQPKARAAIEDMANKLSEDFEISRVESNAILLKHEVLVEGVN